MFLMFSVIMYFFVIMTSFPTVWGKNIDCNKNIEKGVKKNV